MSSPSFDFSQLAPDADKADGIWTRCKLTRRDGKQIDSGVDLLIVYGVDNAAFETRQAVIGGKLQRLAKGKPVPIDKINRGGKQALAGTVLKDWKGYVFNREEIPFSVEAAEAALLRNVQFADFVNNFAGDLANFRTEQAPVTEEADTDDTDEEADHSPEGALKSDGPVG